MFHKDRRSVPDRETIWTSVAVWLPINDTTAWHHNMHDNTTTISTRVNPHNWNK
jgi:hypothetical protein